MEIIFKRLRRRTLEDWTVDTINTFLMLIVLIVTLYPFYYVLIISLNEGVDAARGGIYFWPREFTWDNYATFVNDEKWRVSFLVSSARTIVGTLIGVLFTSLVAYGLAYKQLIFKKIYFPIIIVAMYFSGGLIPYYVVLRELNLLNSFAVYVVPSMLNLFFLLIAISFFKEIPDELQESARIDGANDLTIFYKIILPVSRPLLATMALFLGVGQWNSWVDSAYFVQSDNLRTLTYRMMEIINQSTMPIDSVGSNYASSMNTVTTFSIQITAMVVAILPIVCVYPFLQKHFVKGVMIGAVKG
ncbi:carbohydrate ABC transporter permease [Paenibacillus sp. LHD-38]|uniref:carbohydrate ABC transporter permease n=1 Tax=Paenibacillus sp. LHD-38 TaxID=3072143 RepID=UPI0028105323|nr:carbohydrate ABC transporter permease [Paenibacillus sp. LHD-38]MDQ8738142.1 carbohydrate ABC transporter permease [Paenibacillus sp. LHD-38]